MSKLAKILGVKAPKVSEQVVQTQAVQTEKVDNETEDLKEQQNAKLRSLRGRNSGSRSLLSGLETGVTDDAEELRKTLG